MLQLLTIGSLASLSLQTTTSLFLSETLDDCKKYVGLTECTDCGDYTYPTASRYPFT